MNRLLKSFSFRLSLRFMILLTVIVLLLSVIFVFLVNSFVRASQTESLKKATSEIILDLNTSKESEFHSIPYYFSFVVFEKNSRNVLSSNDPFLPLLEDSNGKSRNLLLKNYFYDGDLNILYFSRDFYLKNQLCTVVVSMNMDTDSFIQIYKNLPKAIFAIVIPILFVSFLISLFLTRNTMKPVIKITKSAETLSLANIQDNEQLLPLSGYDDEIDQLSRTFNELFKRLKSDFDRERQFSSDVAHELNTPLTVISGQTNLLLRWGKDDPAQLDKSLAAIKDEAKSMGVIISNLLQISRVESGRIKPNLRDVDLKLLFSRLSEELNSYSPESEMIIECGDINVNTDEEMLHQILTVLISNSVKFCDKKCVIKLSAREIALGKVRIEEEDNGPGLNEKDVPHIFERFYRGDESHTRKAGGSGLGLSIAKTLVSALGGEIGALYSENSGARFFIEV